VLPRITARIDVFSELCPHDVMPADLPISLGRTKTPGDLVLQKVPEDVSACSQATPKKPVGSG
jgi:hypothetical protein